MSARVQEPRNLVAALRALNEEQRDSTVLVSGTPGGRIHVRRGLVVGIETSGTPGVEAMLLQAGYVDDAAWASARAAAHDHGHGLAAEFEKRGLLTVQEYDIICTAAVFDAAFALALGSPDGWEVADPDPGAVVGTALDPKRVATETTRRITVISELWSSPSSLAATRVRPASTGPFRVRGRYAALLQAANGRRTPRDLGFALGRGTYAVMLDLCRLHSLGLLHSDLPEERAARPSTAPRRQGKDTAPASEPATLPRRAPGQHPLGGAERA
ncbi:hypothetical protein AB0F46_40095 [Streptomyces sp. NPDC026665]|uniref:hypothetical protein n=1 Tax=Streptomyces sp. NPDC026665 TaxID=3154798 RepID=UPI0033CDA5A6